MHPTALFPSIPAVPLYSLAAYTLAVPLIALFRREGHYFKAPFTDERGYRNPTLADDGIAVALTLPILLATATWWEVYSSADATGLGVGLPGIRSLVDVWEANGVRAASSPKLAQNFDLSALRHPIEQARTLFRARYELVLLTSLNAVTLLLHLVLAWTIFRVENLPRSNTKRFFGFMAVAATISTAVWALLTIADHRTEGKSRFRLKYQSPSGRADVRYRRPTPAVTARGGGVDLHPAIFVLYRLASSSSRLYSRRAEHDDGGRQRAVPRVLEVIPCTSAYSLPR
jgi:hypothetical protein